MTEQEKISSADLTQLIYMVKKVEEAQQILAREQEARMAIEAYNAMRDSIWEKYDLQPNDQVIDGGVIVRKTSPIVNVPAKAISANSHGEEAPMLFTNREARRRKS